MIQRPIHLGIFTESMNPNVKEATQVVLEEEGFIAYYVALDNQKWIIL